MITFKTERLAGKSVRIWRFNQRDGSSRSLDEFPTARRMEFSAPTRATTENWILMLADAARNYPAPGVAMEQNATENVHDFRNQHADEWQLPN